MMIETSYQIRVQAKSSYISGQSEPEGGRYVFSYTITLQNSGSIPVKLINRYWLITDGNGKRSEVRGEGVVGEQPHLKPGERFQYSSGTVLETPVGTMEGHYQMVADDGVRFEATIPRMSLRNPQILH